MQLWATSDWQLHHNNVSAHASCLVQSFLVKHQITQVTQPRYSPDLVPCDFWLFPKTKITFEREDISDHQWDSGIYTRAADGDWENCVRSQGAYFEGDWGIIVLCKMFLVSCIFFNNYMSGYILGRLMYDPCSSSLPALPCLHSEAHKYKPHTHSVSLPVSLFIVLQWPLHASKTLQFQWVNPSFHSQVSISHSLYCGVALVLSVLLQFEQLYLYITKSHFSLFKFVVEEIDKE